MAVQMAEVGNTVGKERAAGTAGVPVGREHEVVDDELGAAGEQVRQAHLFAITVGEGIVALDLDDGKGAALAGQGVAGAGVLLFGFKEGEAVGEVFGGGDDLDKFSKEAWRGLVLDSRTPA